MSSSVTAKPLKGKQRPGIGPKRHKKNVFNETPRLTDSLNRLGTWVLKLNSLQVPGNLFQVPTKHKAGGVSEQDRARRAEETRLTGIKLCFQGYSERCPLNVAIPDILKIYLNYK